MAMLYPAVDGRRSDKSVVDLILAWIMHGIDWGRTHRLPGGCDDRIMQMKKKNVTMSLALFGLGINSWGWGSDSSMMK